MIARMNSHQRRVTRRYWRHTWEFQEISLEQYEEIRGWCFKNLGNVGYRWGNERWYTVFTFRREIDYSLFLLTWS
jgi:hypothetical protein